MSSKNVIVGWTGRLSLDRFCEVAGLMDDRPEIVSRIPLQGMDANVLVAVRVQEVVALLVSRFGRYKVAYVDWTSNGGRFRNLVCFFIAYLLSAGSVKIVEDGNLTNTGNFFSRQVRRLYDKDMAIYVTLILCANLAAIVVRAKKIVWGIFYPLIMLCSISFGERAHLQEKMAEHSARYGRIDYWLSQANFKRKPLLIAIAYGALFAAWTVPMYAMLLILRVFRGMTRPVDPRTAILFVSHECRLNGAPQSLLTLLAGLDRKEFRPLLLVPSEGQLADAARAIGVDVYITPLSQVLMQRPNRFALCRHFVRLLVSIGAIMGLIVRERVSRVHINVAVTPDAALAGRLLVVPVVWHFRETIGVSRWSRFQIWVLKRFSSLVVCNSEFTRARIAELGCPYTRSITLHNCIDDKFGGWRHSRAEVRRELKIPESTVLVGCVGQITSDKGQDIFVRSAGLVAKDHPDVRFVLVGTLENAEYVAELRRIAAEQGIEDRLLFLGFRTDIGRIISALDIHVTPSRWDEPFGRVALESMALGAVSIVSDRGGLPEIVQNGESGLVFASEDVDGLARLLNELVSNPEERHNLASKGLEHARAEFSSLRHVDDFQHLIRYPFHPERTGRFNSMWRRLAPVLPRRLRANLWCVPAYLLLLVIVLMVWSISISCFLAALPFALFAGWAARHLHCSGDIAVLAYQTKRNASTRFRVTRLFDRMRAFGVKSKVFYPSNEWLGDIFYSSLFYGEHPYLKDFYYYAIIFPVRLYGIICCLFYRSVLIQYELFYEGPMWLERLVIRLHPRVYYDYDDSLFAFSRYAKELPKILPRFHHIVVGNAYLADYTQKFNSNVTLIPTCPDQTSERIPVSEDKRLVIGWVGNPANLSYLRMLRKPIEELSKRYNIEVLVVSAGPYQLQWFGLQGLPIRRRQWALYRELSDLQDMDIGVMPVDEDEIGRGKCGFKALQYMAAGVPTIASPVGVNAEIVEHLKNGFLANSESEWTEYMERLIDDKALRIRFGVIGREKVAQTFDQDQQVNRWIVLIDDTLSKVG
ncbi:glycosyltransferase family 4 protein [Dyella sp.]|uniref:glycosyltransferase family 4 protein n=1 Tax=Dyella sp. TaxID=1869338 RepID=UPI002FDA4446